MAVAATTRNPDWSDGRLVASSSDRYASLKPEVKVKPSSRRQGMWDVYVGGIHRATKPTKKGAEGYGRRIWEANPSRRRNHHLDSMIAEIETAERPKLETIARKLGMQVRWRGDIEDRRAEVLAKAESREADEADSVQAFIDFHGRSPREVLDFQEPHIPTGEYSALADLTGFWLSPVKGGDPNKWGNPEMEWDRKDGIKIGVLGKRIEGRQIYIFGEVTFPNTRPETKDDVSPAQWLKQFPVGGDFVEFGTVYGILYVTEKVFTGFRSKPYGHEFGERDGKRPKLYFDTVLNRLALVGGNYRILPPDPATDNISPGIEN